MVDANIHVLDRGHIRVDMNHLIEGKSLATYDNPDPDPVIQDVPVYNLVIEHPEGTILWDTGSHHDAPNGYWPDALFQAFPHYDADEHRLDDELEEAGFSINDIDYVFQTHLHLDHAGGLEFFDGRDVPVFVHEEELKFAYYSAKSSAGSVAYVPNDFDHDLTWRVIHTDRESHFEDIEFIRLPGHTPGVMGTVIHLDDAGTVVFTSDEMYTEENYRDEVPLGGGLTWSKRHWFDSMQQLQALERQHDAEIIYGHDPEQVEQFKDTGWP